MWAWDRLKNIGQENMAKQNDIDTLMLVGRCCCAAGMADQQVALPYRL